MTIRRQRTYSRAEWDEARALWADGGFSDEWRSWRHTAAMRCGIIYPPTGLATDSWEDDEPSQRAILIRAIRETPKLLDRSMRPDCRSWGDVIAYLLRGRDDLRARLEDEDRDARRDRLDEQPTHAEAAMVLGAIMRRIRDSVG